MDECGKMRFILEPLHHCVIIPKFAIVTWMGTVQIIVDGNKLSEAGEPTVGHVGQAVICQVLGYFV
jgi:hypothetical protein